MSFPTNFQRIGSFKNPVPGTPISQTPSDPNWALGQKVSALNDEVARQNFRVVIIKPTEVEQLDLSVPDKARRWRFTYVGRNVTGDGGENTGEWMKEELWP